MDEWGWAEAQRVGRVYFGPALPLIETGNLPSANRPIPKITQDHLNSVPKIALESPYVEATLLDFEFAVPPGPRSGSAPSVDVSAPAPISGLAPSVGT